MCMEMNDSKNDLDTLITTRISLMNAMLQHYTGINEKMLTDGAIYKIHEQELSYDSPK